MRNYINETERRKREVEGISPGVPMLVIQTLIVVGIMLMVGVILTTCSGVPA